MMTDLVCCWNHKTVGCSTTFLFYVWQCCAMYLWQVTGDHTLFNALFTVGFLHFCDYYNLIYCLHLCTDPITKNYLLILGAEYDCQNQFTGSNFKICISKFLKPKICNTNTFLSNACSDLFQQLFSSGYGSGKFLILFFIGLKS